MWGPVQNKLKHMPPVGEKTYSMKVCNKGGLREKPENMLPQVSKDEIYI